MGNIWPGSKKAQQEKRFRDFVRNNDYNNADYEYTRSDANMKRFLLTAVDREKETPCISWVI